MSNNNQIVKLKRDCPAVLIPAGEPITLKAGQELTITQALGGSYTVIVMGNMARIEGSDADALGLEDVEQAPATPEIQTDGVVSEPALWEQLKSCYDPEIPVNIVDLGLIYDLQVTKLENGGSKVDIKMTLTAPGCGMGPAIAADAHTKIMALQGVAEANVELVWEPMWNQTMMTEAARLKLGFM